MRSGLGSIERRTRERWHERIDPFGLAIRHDGVGVSDADLNFANPAFKAKSPGEWADHCPLRRLELVWLWPFVL